MPPTFTEPELSILKLLRRCPNNEAWHHYLRDEGGLSCDATKRACLDLFSKGYLEAVDGKWKLTEKGKQIK